MRILLTTTGLLLVAGIAFAGSPPAADVAVDLRIPCNLPVVAYDWDFAVSDQGFTTTTCDPTGGAPVWEYGSTTYVPGAPGNVWGTVLNDDYGNDSGQGLVSPSFLVGTNSNMMEILHFVHIETNFDGGNVTVDGQVVPPMNGYPAVISTSTSFYAFCTDAEEGFTGNGFSGPSEAWVQRCFDLSAFEGQTVSVEFDFGSDSSVVYPGWYLAYVRVGGQSTTPVEQGTWGSIKNLYQ